LKNLSEDRTGTAGRTHRSRTRQQKRSLPRSQEYALPNLQPPSCHSSRFFRSKQQRNTNQERARASSYICLAGDQTKELEKPKEQLGSSLPVPVKLPNRILKCMQSGGLEFGVWRMSVCPSPSVCGQPDTQRDAVAISHLGSFLTACPTHGNFLFFTNY